MQHQVGILAGRHSDNGRGHFAQFKLDLLKPQIWRQKIKKKYLQPASYDFKLSNTFWYWKNGEL